MIEDNIQTLNLISKDKNITQRKIANILNISLGKVNLIIKNLNDNNYIDVETKGRKKSYHIVSDGYKFLETQLKQSNEFRVQLHNDEFNNIKLAVILGAGVVKNSDRPSGFKLYNGKQIIERAIDILYSLGIEKIIIVTGFKSHFYESLALKHERIILIKNTDYESTGSMVSLSMCKEYINNDFILIENDLIFDLDILGDLIKDSNKDCAIISDYNEEDNQLFVEIRNQKIFKISKDKRDFNKIDGEFVGITKISQKFFQLMLNEINSSTNKLVNYEHIMLDVARCYSIGVNFISRFKWNEIS